MPNDHYIVWNCITGIRDKNNKECYERFYKRN